MMILCLAAQWLPMAHIQQQHEELEKQNKRSRAKKSMLSRKAQKTIIEQRNLNPVLDSCG